MWFLLLVGVAAIGLYVVNRSAPEVLARVGGSFTDAGASFLRLVESALKSVPLPAPLAGVPGAILGLAEAIKAFEGFYPGSRAYRNNNPGNLKYTSWTRGQGATHADDKGFSVFPDYATGWKALLALLMLRRRQHPDWSILDLMMSYAPPSDGNPTGAYAASVAKHVGGDINTKLGELV